jgi:predicted DsbA family dithiol-disulfide isomerase
MTATVTIDLFSDIVCPWCYIGATRLEQALAGLSGELEAEVCYHPFCLDPQLPKSGVSLPEKLRHKYGVDPTQLRQLFARVEGAARDSGLELDLTRQVMTYPTEAAHTLLRHAHAKGTQPALAAAFFRSYFVDAQNIADETILASVAERHGFTHDEALELATAPAELQLTREEAAAAVQGGIRGVPFFIFDGRFAISGAQQVTVLQAALRKALESPSCSEPPASPFA